mmetsp:Transcript_18975/g.53015  ORF Transcript_18975/g.53015 Transcript_18975/m.53015 type:complete len:263 (+) Transcript_18975:2469-3257(+)
MRLIRRRRSTRPPWSSSRRARISRSTPRLSGAAPRARRRPRLHRSLVRRSPRATRRNRKSHSGSSARRRRAAAWMWAPSTGRGRRSRKRTGRPARRRLRRQRSPGSWRWMTSTRPQPARSTRGKSRPTRSGISSRPPGRGSSRMHPRSTAMPTRCSALRNAKPLRRTSRISRDRGLSWSSSGNSGRTPRQRTSSRSWKWRQNPRRSTMKRCLSSITRPTTKSSRRRSARPPGAPPRRARARPSRSPPGRRRPRSPRACRRSR